MRARRLSKRKTVAVVLGSVVFSLLGGVAQAASWGPVYSNYNDQIRSSGWGDTTNYLGRDVQNAYHIDDWANDGNNVYGKSWFLFYYSGSWHNEGKKETGDYTYSNTPAVKNLYWPLDPYGEQARSNSTACVSLGFLPDKCSSEALATISY